MLPARYTILLSHPATLRVFDFCRLPCLLSPIVTRKHPFAPCLKSGA